MFESFQVWISYRLNHVYVSEENIKDTAQKVVEIYGRTSVEVHIGNSDNLADFAYKYSAELFEVLSKIKKLNGIKKVIWSEKITKLHQKDDISLLNR